MAVQRAVAPPAPAKKTTKKPAAEKPVVEKKPIVKAAPKAAPKPAAAPTPTSDEALRAHPVTYADPPDIPVAVAQGELASLARLAKARAAKLAEVGITAEQITTLAQFAKSLADREATWQLARKGVKLTAAERRYLEEAEKLDAKLVAGGRWACRKDPDALDDLNTIAEGSGITDTVGDLRALVTFWAAHPDEQKNTKITAKDLARAAELADLLEPAAAKEEADLTAAESFELRNRCFWAADELAKEIREGGRYAFESEPKVAAKFVSRYRATASRRSKRKAKAKAKNTAAKNAATKNAPTPALNGG